MDESETPTVASGVCCGPHSVLDGLAYHMTPFQAEHAQYWRDKRGKSER